MRGARRSLARQSQSPSLESARPEWRALLHRIDPLRPSMESLSTNIRRAGAISVHVFTRVH